VATAVKKKAPAAKKTTGDGSDEVAVMPPRAPVKNKNFLIDGTDRFLVAYYGKGVNNYADVAIMVNDTIKKGSHDVQVAEFGARRWWCTSNGSAPAHPSWQKKITPPPTR
jgi:hypothetical protein